MVDFLDTFEYYSACTPDFIELSKSNQKEFIIFVYDVMKMGYQNHGMLKGANYYGRASTLLSNYTLRDAGGGQAVGFSVKDKRFEDEKKVDSMHLSHIHGELYGVSLRVLADIDFLLANGSMFHRIKKFFCPHDNPNKKFNAIEGFIYVGDQKYWGSSDGIMKRMTRCDDTSINKTNGFYWGTDPRTDEEVRDEMYEEYEAYGYGAGWGRGHYNHNMY